MSAQSMHFLVYRVPECGIFDAMFTVVSDAKRLEGDVIKEFPNLQIDQCIYRCVEHLSCKSINFHLHEGRRGTCQLSSSEVGDFGSKLLSMRGWIHLQTPSEDQQDKVRFRYIVYLFVLTSPSYLMIIVCNIRFQLNT